MTKPRYQAGCVAGSKESGKASSPSDNAIYVNLNNGNVNWNNQNNSGFVRACRLVPASECRGASTVNLRGLVRAKRAARRRKKPSYNFARFEAGWIDPVFDTLEQIIALTWRPSRPTAFIVGDGKAREIHAPDAVDRMVHHWAMPYLEPIQNDFIDDSYANREGKGTHAAVTQLGRHVRQVHSGQGGGHYLQIDVYSYFRSIHRPTAWRLLKRWMIKHGVPEEVQRVMHALLCQSLKRSEVNYRATQAERELIPWEKRMENAEPLCGLALGNLPSQMVANIYLHEVDVFAKHVLKIPRYMRYVDDIVIVHQSREQLMEWQAAIEKFLAEHLRLRLKDEKKLEPLTSGIDFLGYIVYPTHTTVRRRVIDHAREKLWAWQRDHVRGSEIHATPDEYRKVVAIWQSYLGHFRHANSHNLIADFHRRFPFLGALSTTRRFHHDVEHQLVIPFNREAANASL